jgi:hypothetical protein
MPYEASNSRNGLGERIIVSIAFQDLELGYGVLEI